MAEYLTISHLQKQFGDVQVLKDISLTVNQGKSFPLLALLVLENRHCCGVPLFWKHSAAEKLPIWGKLR